MFQSILVLRSRFPGRLYMHRISTVIIALNIRFMHLLKTPAGDSGIDGTDLLPKPASAPIHDTSSTEAIHAALLAQPGDSAWLVATGALTNVALLFTEYPELARHISGLSIMGGAIGNGFSAAPMGHVRGEGIRFGNITRWAEFNIYVRTSLSNREYV